MTGVAFMRPYAPHTAHIIKQSDEARTGTPVAISDDGELFAPLKPSTIYTVRIMLVITSTTTISSSNVWRPACTNAVDFCALIYHRGVAQSTTEFWGTTSGGDHQAHLYDTTAFNTPLNFNCSQVGARRCTGILQTGSSGGTFSIKWGGGNGQRQVEAGSFMYLQEARAA